MRTIDPIGLLLYTDLCSTNGQISDPKSLRSVQVDMILSLRANGLEPEYDADGNRSWSISHKKRH